MAEEAHQVRASHVGKGCPHQFPGISGQTSCLYLLKELLRVLRGEQERGVNIAVREHPAQHTRQRRVLSPNGTDEELVDLLLIETEHIEDENGIVGLALVPKVFQERIGVRVHALLERLHGGLGSGWRLNLIENPAFSECQGTRALALSFLEERGEPL